MAHPGAIAVTVTVLVDRRLQNGDGYQSDGVSANLRRRFLAPVPCGRAHKVIEKAGMKLVRLDQFLRVPLHAEREGQIGRFQALDQPIFRDRNRAQTMADGGDPLVVRVGASTYALRRAEAACVQVVQAGGVA